MLDILYIYKIENPATINEPNGFVKEDIERCFSRILNYEGYSVIERLKSGEKLFTQLTITKQYNEKYPLIKDFPHSCSLATVFFLFKINKDENIDCYMLPEICSERGLKYRMKGMKKNGELFHSFKITKEKLIVCYNGYKIENPTKNLAPYADDNEPKVLESKRKSFLEKYVIRNFKGIDEILRYEDRLECSNALCEGFYTKEIEESVTKYNEEHTIYFECHINKSDEEDCFTVNCYDSGKKDEPYHSFKITKE